MKNRGGIAELGQGGASAGRMGILPAGLAVRTGDAADIRRDVLLVIAIATALQLLLAGLSGINFDGFYTLTIAREFSWSYYDHPPLHLWIANGAARLFGSDAPFFVKLPFVALFAGSSWLLFRLTAVAFGERAGLWAVVAYNVSLVFTVVFATWIFPDGPLDFFLLASALMVARVVIEKPEPPAPILWWLGAGVAMGLALLSKYTAVLFFPAMLVYLLTDPERRRWLATPGPWLGVLVALVVFSPVIFWNANHGFASFSYQGDRGLIAGRQTPQWLLESILGQLGYLQPWIAVPLALVLYRALSGGPRDARPWFFACLAIGPIVIFTLLNIFQRGQPHWPMPGWLFVFPLLGAWIATLGPAALRIVRGIAIGTAALLVVAFGVLTLQEQTGLVGKAVPVLFARGDPTVFSLDWRSLKSELQSRGQLDGRHFVMALDWHPAANAEFILDGDPPVVCLCAPDRLHHLQFQPVPDVAGQDAVIIDSPILSIKNTIDPRAYFDSVEALPSIPIRRPNGDIAFKLKAWLGHNYHPTPEGRDGGAHGFRKPCALILPPPDADLRRPARLEYGCPCCGGFRFGHAAGGRRARIDRRRPDVQRARQHPDPDCAAEAVPRGHTLGSGVRR